MERIDMSTEKNYRDDDRPEPTAHAPEDEVAILAALAMERMANHKRYPYPATPISQTLCEWAALYNGAIRRKYIGPARGLALFGGVGTGKTTALQCLSSILGIPFLAVSALDAVYAHHGDAGIMDCMDRYTTTAVCIDDIGTERARHFGAEFPMGDILARRYDLWQRRRVCTLLSGNLTADERLLRYGTRIVDRINEMCVTVPCVWPSFRKQASGFRVYAQGGITATGAA